MNGRGTAKTDPSRTVMVVRPGNFASRAALVLAISTRSANHLDLKRCRRHLHTARFDRGLHAQPTERAADHAAREVEMLDEPPTKSARVSFFSPLIFRTKEPFLRDGRRKAARGQGHRTYHLRPLHRLLHRLAARPPVDTHARQRMEARVRQHERATVVRLEVVDLLAAEEQGPEVLAEELDRFERARRTRTREREAVLPAGCESADCSG
nr:hypothetical protein CFP56_33597 [Quercus suber]